MKVVLCLALAVLCLFGTVSAAPNGAMNSAGLPIWTKRGVRRLRRSRLDQRTAKYMRLDRKELIARVKQAHDVDTRHTHLVFGNRGCGKSTLLNLAFAGTPGVVNINLSSSHSHLAIYKELAIQLKVAGDWGQLRDKYIVQEVLNAYKKRYKKVAVVIISLDAKVPTHVLEAVISECKSMGYDLELAIFFIDLSNAMAATQINTNLDSLRCEGIFVPATTGEEAMRYVKDMIQKEAIALDETAVEELSALAIQNLGGNFVALDKVARAVLQCQMPSSKTWVQTAIEKAIALRKKAAITGFRIFLQYALDATRASSTVLADRLEPLLNAMLNKGERKVTLDDMVTALAVTEMEFADLNMIPSVHPFAIDPFSRALSFSRPDVVLVAPMVSAELAGKMRNAKIILNPCLTGRRYPP